jgi:hypothetical protein
MNTRPFIIWLSLAISLISLYGIYQWEANVGEILEWVDKITIVLPGVILLLFFLSWATKTEEHRAWKVVGGIATGSVVTIVLWIKYIKQFGEYLESIKGIVENVLYSLVILAVITLAIMTHRKQTKTS